MVPSWADQLLLQLLMEQFDTLPIQCRHIEHMHEGVWFTKNNFDKMTTVRTYTIIFVCTDSTKIFFQNLGLLVLNYNSPSFFTESYCAGGI